MYYIYTDKLGSIRAVSNSSGILQQVLSYDAWGNRRDPQSGVNYTTAPANLMFYRGYTGHEHLDGLGLINMNGRVYDPVIALFLSPDNYVQSSENTQNYNKYSYCLNNPLRFTDPSGEIIASLVTLGISYIYQEYFAPPSSLNTEFVSRNALIGTGVSAIVNCFIPGADGIIHGIIQGALAGGLSGGITSATIAKLSGEDVSDAFKQGFKSGALNGMISGGINGFETAKARGLNYWWGTQRKDWAWGRNQWSFAWWDGPIEFQAPGNYTGLDFRCDVYTQANIYNRDPLGEDIRMKKYYQSSYDDFFNNQGIAYDIETGVNFNKLKELRANGYNKMITRVNNYGDKFEEHQMATVSIRHKFMSNELLLKVKDSAAPRTNLFNRPSITKT